MLLVNLFTSLKELKEDTPSDILKGVRAQLYYALLYLHRGHPMVVEHVIPLDTPKHELNRLHRMLKDNFYWSDIEKLTPVIVPGTHYPKPIGQLLLKLEWVSPTEHIHWVPNLKFFRLNQKGAKSLEKAKKWWDSLTFQQKLLLRFVE